MPNQQEKSVDLSIRNNVVDLAIVTKALDHLGDEFQIPTKALMQLQVALDEILSNIIKYAWPERSAHEIRLRMSAHDGRIEILIVDDGAPFDPRDHESREPPPPGTRPQPGGVGIQMVKQLVDSFDYARIDGCNKVILIKRYAS
jgi:anti-sigma regulatory factor (Ser/Thr protein kinase)